MKKAYILAALFIMIFTLVGCGGGGGGGSHEDDQNVDIRSEVNDFLDQFCVNNVSGNINGIIGAYQFPFEFVNTAGISVQYSESEMRSDLANLYGDYDVISYSLENRALSYHPDGVTVTVSATKSYERKLKTSDARTNSGYHILMTVSKSSGSWKIAKEDLSS